jgi:hypothetical protein
MELHLFSFFGALPCAIIRRYLVKTDCYALIELEFLPAHRSEAQEGPPFFSRKKVEDAFIIALFSGKETPLGYCNCKI